MTEGLLSHLRLANVLFWLAVVSTSVQAGSFSAINITFPMFMDEVTQKRVTYYEGDSLLVTWSAITTIRYLDLYWSRSDELSWGGHPYGSGVMDFLFYASGDKGNAKKSKFSLVTFVSRRNQKLFLGCLPAVRKEDVLFWFLENHAASRLLL